LKGLPIFTAENADRAYDVWGANCGPIAIAAMCGWHIDELRAEMGDFESKRYTNPTLMWEVLNRIGAQYRLVKPPDAWPNYGLVRIQWEGPWTEPNVPMRARYRQTHWIGAQRANGAVGIFDCNAFANGTGWCSEADWETVIVPAILEMYPRASGKWHRTHVVELEG
jgi:hypothetical protein